MTNIDRLDDLLFKIGTGTGGDYAELIDIAADVVSEVRRETDPQIIRNVEEMEGMDPDTVVLGGGDKGFICFVRQWLAGDEVDREIHQRYLPGVVLTSAEQVRAARKALEEA